MSHDMFGTVRTGRRHRERGWRTTCLPSDFVEEVVVPGVVAGPGGARLHAGQGQRPANTGTAEHVCVRSVSRIVG